MKLEVGDQSGRLGAKLWNDADHFYQELQVGQVLKIKGIIQSYRNSRELWVEKIRPARVDECQNLSDFIPSGKKEVRDLLLKIQAHRKSIQDKYLLRLQEVIFPDEKRWLSYLSMPSGKLWHHNYLQGNMEHIACLLDLADSIFVHYPDINLDILKSGILLHNIGNMSEFSWEKGFIDYTTEGRLIGHTVKNCLVLQEAFRQVENFPKYLETQLMHLIISQEDNPDKKACLPPMTREAIILNLLIQVDIFANAAERIMRTERLEDSEWTRFDHLFQRFLYVGLVGRTTDQS